jgi:hypothetical protein
MLDQVSAAWIGASVTRRITAVAPKAGQVGRVEPFLRVRHRAEHQRGALHGDRTTRHHGGPGITDRHARLAAEGGSERERANFSTPSPTASTATSDATPMITPSVDRKVRKGLLRRLAKPTLTGAENAV